MSLVAKYGLIELKRGMIVKDKTLYDIESK